MVQYALNFQTFEQAELLPGNGIIGDGVLTQESNPARMIPNCNVRLVVEEWNNRPALFNFLRQR
jgi:hypothetical protein